MLTVHDLQVTYGPVRAVHGISFHVDDGELVTILGANGAGKTSTLNAVVGLVPVAAGAITFSGADLLAQPTEARARLGIGLTPEGRRVFGPLSVRDNLRAGGSTLSPNQCEARMEEVMGRFPILQQRAEQEAGTLSGGEQQMLAIARALMPNPTFLILDEPSLGLAPKIVSQVFELIAELKSEGTTILLVEQNVKKSLAVADRAYVMELGRIVREGAADELAADPVIHEAYLGAV
ncbi:MAG: ABC transporter ATP-binding protein [SAR324 cluster bacterium]|nr:ABC transporter ATP-binding protein [SAR324 cluster bacterium]